MGWQEETEAKTNFLIKAQSLMGVSKYLYGGTLPPKSEYSHRTSLLAPQVGSDRWLVTLRKLLVLGEHWSSHWSEYCTLGRGVVVISVQRLGNEFHLGQCQVPARWHGTSIQISTYLHKITSFFFTYVCKVFQKTFYTGQLHGIF